MRKGPVSSRVALLLRSAEGKPSSPRFLVPGGLRPGETREDEIELILGVERPDGVIFRCVVGELPGRNVSFCGIILKLYVLLAGRLDGECLGRSNPCALEGFREGGGGINIADKGLYCSGLVAGLSRGRLIVCQCYRLGQAGGP